MWLRDPQAPDWNTYAAQAQKYLNRPAFSGSPIDGSMMARGAQNAYYNYNRQVPLDLALAQGQFETKLGTAANTSGRPNKKTNPWNVGEYDNGTMLKFPDTMAGVQAYYNLMAKKYLATRTPEQLYKNFVNTAGNRYASDSRYEKKIGDQATFISKFLNKGGSSG